MLGLGKVDVTLSPDSVGNIKGNDQKAVIKRPARDACSCMGDLQAPPAPAAPPAPHFVFLITL